VPVFADVSEDDVVISSEPGVELDPPGFAPVQPCSNAPNVASNTRSRARFRDPSNPKDSEINTFIRYRRYQKNLF
jgi:hypothetical protein